MSSNASLYLYKNIEMTLQIVLTLPTTVASCDCSFTKLKLTKNCLRSAPAQEHASAIVIAVQKNYNDITDEFKASEYNIP